MGATEDEASRQTAPHGDMVAHPEGSSNSRLVRHRVRGETPPTQGGEVAGMSEPLVPDDFEVPLRFETQAFVLEPLGPEHNERDHAAWS